MTRDYRHGHGQKQAFQRKSQQEKSGKVSTSGFSIWVVALVVSVILVLVFFVVNLFLSQEKETLSATEQRVLQATKEVKKTPDTSAEVIVESAPLKESEEVAFEEKEVNHSNHYSFYHGLSQTEVVVEAELISVALTQPYYIQAGSFGSEKIAKQEQRRLAKHGQILTVSGLTKGKRTYYRLRVGPFKDRLVMNKQRNELRRLGVDTLLIKAAK
ncbi:MAG: SPOR domain-containing protein [Thiomicrorhabdus sp.]|nr:SPOR domain-containing protein [Thiomicrorhabdus sp.]